MILMFTIGRLGVLPAAAASKPVILLIADQISPATIVKIGYEHYFSVAYYCLPPSFTAFRLKYVIRGATLGGIVRSVVLIECFLLSFVSIVILYSR